MNLLVETNTYGFATGSKYPGCLDQGKVCLGGGINGDWAGSAERALQMASWLKDLGFNPGSQKRSNKLTASGNRSDHWDGSKDSYGIDLPCRGEKGDKGWKKLREEFVKRGWISEDKMPDKLLQKGNGKWINFNVGTYRYQVGWNVKDHYDHIHVGVRNKKPDEKYSSTDDSESQDSKEVSNEVVPKIKKIFYTAFSFKEQSIIEGVLEKLDSLNVKDNFSKIVLASLVIYKKDSIIKDDKTSNSDAETFINDLKDKTFNSLDECLDYFEKELGKREFNRSEIKTIAEKFEVKVSDDTGAEIKIDLEKIRAFMKKFKEIFSSGEEVSEVELPKVNLKKEEESLKLNEELNRIKDLMKKIL